MDQLRVLIDDVGGLRRAARICGVHESTVRRWMRHATRLPEASYRALYSASRWGKSDRQVMTANERQALLQQIDAMTRQICALENEIARLMRLGDFGAANAPRFTDRVA
jgi:transposase-like protein